MDTVRFEAICEAVCEVAGVQDEDVVAGFGEIGSDLIPAECAGAGENEGLRGGRGGLEEFAEELEGVGECVDEGHADVGFTGVGC